VELMENSMNRLCLTSLVLLSVSGPAWAQAPERPAAPPATTNFPAVTFGVQSFLQYRAELHEMDGYNAFDVTRGYFNVEARLTDRVTVRFTPDVRPTTDVNLDRNLALRLEYASLDVQATDGVSIMFGLHEMPWLTFEESLNRYRVLGPLFATKGVDFATELEPVSVRADVDRLGQVVSNLLSNALRHTRRGGRVDLRVRRANGWAVLEVADTGVGIAPEDLKHVFKRFWRGEKSRSRATGGAGIGLAIVHELVRAHDGRIDVESRPGVGSTFRVSLPVFDTRGLHENGRRASPDLQTPTRP